MGLNRVRLGDLIEPYSESCNNPRLSENDVSGVDREKEFFEPSRQVGADTSKYKVVPPNYFACNLMHVGRDYVLPVALNHTKKNKIVSPAYDVFRVIEGAPIMREYLMAILKSAEKDRYFWFMTDSSVRDSMAWDDFCAAEIDLPPLDIQQKYVAVYRAMLANQASFERGLDDLKLTCDAYIEQLRQTVPKQPIGFYIRECNEKNVDLSVTLTQGVDVNMQFIPAKREAFDKEGTRIVRKGQFAFNKVIKSNGTKFPIALRKGDDCIVSGSYQVFEVIDPKRLLPEYLMLWLSRSETQRYCGFQAWGSTRDVFPFSELCKLEFPIPSIEVQQSIVKMYETYGIRKNLAKRLGECIKEICPILIKGSIEGTQKKEALNGFLF